MLNDLSTQRVQFKQRKLNDVGSQINEKSIAATNIDLTATANDLILKVRASMQS